MTGNLREVAVLDIHAVMGRLARERPVFHSEADFQFALAWQIREMGVTREVRLEFRQGPEEPRYLDIWLPGLRTALELKYPTRTLNVEGREEVFALKDGAPDFARYDFVKDIERLEDVATRGPARWGAAVLLTNDPSFWDPSRRHSRPTDDENFRIHEGQSIHGTLAWPDKKRAAKGKEREGPIHLEGSYLCRWRDYGRPVPAAPGEKYNRFRYLALEVPRV